MKKYFTKKNLRRLLIIMIGIAIWYLIMVGMQECTRFVNYVIWGKMI